MTFYLIKEFRSFYHKYDLFSFLYYLVILFLFYLINHIFRTFYIIFIYILNEFFLIFNLYTGRSIHDFLFSKKFIFRIVSLVYYLLIRSILYDTLRFPKFDTEVADFFGFFCFKHFQMIILLLFIDYWRFLII